MRVPSDRPKKPKNGEFAGYIHRLDSIPEDIKNNIINVSPKKELPRAGNSVCHNVYSALLEMPELALTTTDYRRLADWGVSVEMAKRLKYRRLPLRGRAKICRTLIEKGYNLEGVPGFYVHDDGYWTMSTGPGLIFPSMSPYRLIQGFQVRLDSPPVEEKDVTGKTYFDTKDWRIVRIVKKGVATGVSKGLTYVVANYKNKKISIPVKVEGEPGPESENVQNVILRFNFTDSIVGHDLITIKQGSTVVFKTFEDKVSSKYVWFSSQGRPGGASSGSMWHLAVSKNKEPRYLGITEGIRKADIAANYLGIHVIGLAGVSNFSGVPKFVNSFGLPWLSLFDMDMLNNWHVYQAWISLMQSLKGPGYVGIWDPQYNGKDTKGIDDLLVAGGSPKRVLIETAMRTIKAPPRPVPVLRKVFMAR